MLTKAPSAGTFASCKICEKGCQSIICQNRKFCHNFSPFSAKLVVYDLLVIMNIYTARYR